jgi:hypothetical protein
MRKQNAVAATMLAVSLALSYASAARAGDSEGVDSLFEKTVPIEIMSVQRGKVVITTMEVDGSVQDNTAISNVTGRNVITGSSFSNASGLSTTIQNSGNNVLIQNATILQLDVR